MSLLTFALLRYQVTSATFPLNVIRFTLLYVRFSGLRR
jgi:hypothetical protein